MYLLLCIGNILIFFTYEAYTSKYTSTYLDGIGGRVREGVAQVGQVYVEGVVVHPLDSLQRTHRIATQQRNKNNKLR